MPLYGVVNAHLLLATVLIGAGIGLISGAFGKGGSAVSTPLLHLAGVPAMIAVASPLPATIPSTLLAGRSYARAGHVDGRVVRIGLAVGLPATAIGAVLTRWIPGGSLVLATDALVLALGLRVLLKEHAADDAGASRAVPLAITAAVVATVGLVSGLLGNSGGFLLAPLFMSVLHMPVRRALGTSLALSAVLAVPGTLVHAWLGHIDWSLTLAFGLASIPLASVGAAIALRMRERRLTLAFGAGLTALATGLLVFAH
ncbi:MAG TPA: sulfite exporter TauE/SafE family protein [Acidimicrobiia bacterium]|nr:sulfite exporter TauE/SafE family protein [Acidimicrobiia bacterium]